MTPIKRNYVHCFIVHKSFEVKPSQFNSFYIEDLQLILSKGANRTLIKFIQGTDMQVDVDENREVIESMLALKKLPLGRWPSPVNHRLSLMQQVSVNHILQSNEIISSVNGPPGTGKTTLLQDVFAQLIVERTIQMVRLKNPRSAFRRVENQVIPMNGKDYTYSMYELDENIAKYSMVVASSNNGAVENISNELPLLEKIARYESNEYNDSNLSRFHEYDRLFTEEIEQINYFTEFAESLLENQKVWGVFSAAFGKAKNIKKVSNSFNKGKEKSHSYIDYLAQPLGENAWEDAVEEFNQLRQEIESDKEEIQEYLQMSEKYQKHIQQLKDIRIELTNEVENKKKLRRQISILENENDLLKQRLENIPQKGKLKSLIRSITGSIGEEEKNIRNNREKVLLEIMQKNRILNESSEKITRFENIKDKLEKQITVTNLQLEKYNREEIARSTDEFWESNAYHERQVSVLWQGHELNFKRSMLFLKALKVHKVFLHKNHDKLKAIFPMLDNLRSINLNIDENKKNIQRMWKTLHLIIPVISTTFASLGSMYKAVDADFIDYLFVDEAGQASPQQAAGAFWRAKRSIVVGDPIQLEPVVTIDETIIADIKKKFNVSDHYIGPTASVQRLSDYANPLGTYKGTIEKRERIGIPLWVHRRCIEPMFSIANEIAYEHKMVLAQNKKGVGKWHDISGRATQAQFVDEQADFIVKKMEEYFNQTECDENPSVFVITPFTIIEKKLISLVSKTLSDRYPNVKQWAKDSIGTVHKFQGKEAEVVYFVTGTDAATDGAANWSCMKPNLINVAVTRAKKEFHVVGDLDRFKSKKYYETILNHFELLGFKT